MLQVPTIIVVFYITISRFFRSLPFETFVICLMVGINFNINSQDNKACNIWVTVIVGTCNVRGYCQYLTNIFFFFRENMISFGVSTKHYIKWLLTCIVLYDNNNKTNTKITVYGFTEADYTGFVKCFPVLDTQHSFRHIH